MQCSTKLHVVVEQYIRDHLSVCSQIMIKSLRFKSMHEIIDERIEAKTPNMEEIDLVVGNVEAQHAVWTSA